MPELDIDPRVVAWLREDHGGASDWVLPSVLAHARRHRRRTFLASLAEALPVPTFGQHRALALQAAAVVSLALVVLGLLVFAAGQRPRELLPLSSPSPTLAASALPSIGSNGLTPPQVIDGYRAAWHAGDVSAGSSHLVPGAHIDVIGSDPMPVLVGPDQALTADDFKITPDGHGYDTWERTGSFASAGAFWAHPAWIGSFDGYEGFSVYRIGADGRIEDIWIVLGTPGRSQGHEVPAPSAPPSLVAFLDDCLASLNRRDADTFATCYASDGDSYLSANAAAGSWTDHFSGRADVRAAVGALGPGDQLIRTGDVLFHEGMLVYPFRSTWGSDCEAGLDVFLMTPDQSRIQTHWAICGPEPH